MREKRLQYLSFDYVANLIQAALESAQMLIMPDIEDPFVPLSDGLFVDPYESK